MVVVSKRGVVVVLVARDHPGCRAQLLALEDLVIVLAEQPVVAQCKLVARSQLPRTRRAPEALDMIDLVACSHVEVVFVKRLAALLALCAKQSATHSPPFIFALFTLFSPIFYLFSTQSR